MTSLQQIAALILLALVLYAIYMTYDEFVRKEATHGPQPSVPVHVPSPAAPDMMPGSNPKLPSAIFDPEATGILPSNHLNNEQKADFVSDITNVNQFYRNNPELFQKTHLDIDWQRKSDAMHQSRASTETEWLGPANHDAIVGGPLI